MQVRQFALTALVSMIAASALAVAPQARAEDGTRCGHPSMSRGAACAAPGIDPNTFLVQPPASTHWLARAPRANGDHPAVLVARRQPAAAVDANTFLVQPPATVAWTVPPSDTLLAGSPAAAR